MPLIKSLLTLFETPRAMKQRQNEEVLRMLYEFEQSPITADSTIAMLDRFEKKAQNGDDYALKGMGFLLSSLADKVDDVAPFIDEVLDRLVPYFSTAEDEAERTIVNILTDRRALSSISSESTRRDLQDKALDILLKHGDRQKLCVAEAGKGVNRAFYGPLVKIAIKTPDMTDRVIDELRQENRYDVKKAVSHILEALVVTPDYTAYALDKADALTEESFFTQKDASGVLDAVFQGNNLTHPVDVKRAREVIDTLKEQYPGKKALLPSFQQAVEDAIVRQEEAQKAALQDCRHFRHLYG